MTSTPKAKETRCLIGGVEFDDPFAWLEEDSRAALDWQEDCEREAKAWLSSLSNKIPAEEIDKYTNACWRYAPQRFGDSWFRLTLGPSGLKLTVADSPYTAQRVLIDLEELLGYDGETSLDYFYPSPDGAFVAFGVSLDGDEQSILHIVETETKSVLPYRIEHTSACQVAWLPDGKSFLFNANEASDLVDARKYLFHFDLTTGTVTPEHACLRHQYIIRPQASDDGEWLAAITSEYEPRPDLIRSTRSSQWEPFLMDVPGILTGIFLGSEYIAISTAGTPNGRLVAIPIETADQISTWRELQPESNRVMRSIERVGEQLVLCEYEDTFCRLRVLSIDGHFEYEIELPGDGVVRQLGLLTNYQLPGLGGENIAAGKQEFTFVYSSLTQSPATYLFDLNTRALELLEPADFIHNNFVHERHSVIADDGFEVRFSTVRHKSTNPDQPNPAVMFGYGNFGVSFIPGYAAPFVPFIERGGVLVFAHLRGGGELGGRQSDSGRFESKFNTFSDAFAIAESLIKRNITTRDQLAFVGASGGGMVAGGIAAHRPDLFRAIVSNVPLLDMMKYTRDPYVSVCRFNFGDPNNPEDAPHLIKWSPYHNVAPAEYPAIFIFGGAEDFRCRPWHIRKMGAKLRANNRGDRPIHILIEKGTGHSAAMRSGKYVSFWLNFIMHELGMTEHVKN